jgi:hypothetical protein
MVDHGGPMGMNCQQKPLDFAENHWDLVGVLATGK